MATAPKQPQELYMGRWVNRNGFRTFVYNQTEQKLAESWDQYKELIASGLWFNTKDLAIAAAQKKKLKAAAPIAPAIPAAPAAAAAPVIAPKVEKPKDGSIG